MNELTEINNHNIQVAQTGNAVDTARAITEVQGAIMVAQKFPRNEFKALEKIESACARIGLAEQAIYSFPRGGKRVEGPSIRLAEALAMHWGNVQFGIREIEKNDKETKFEAYAWDMETNVRTNRIFSKKHGRWTKSNGFTEVNDPRDVYEVVASDAARRLRACILEIIPGDIVDTAVKKCNETMRKSGADKPLVDRVRSLVSAFKPLGVTDAMITKKLGHNLDAISESELVDLRGIYKSLKDDMSKPADWFDSEQYKNNAERLDDMFNDKPKDKDSFDNFEPKNNSVKGAKK